MKKINLIKIKKILTDYLNNSIEFKKSFETISVWIKKSYFTSVDVNEINSGHLNIIRYLIGWLHFILMCLSFFILLAFISIDSLFQLIHSDILPKNFRIILSVGLILLILSFAIRFDILVGEWNTNLKSLEFLYYLYNDHPKHGLTSENYFKLSIVFKIILLMLYKFLAPLFAILLTLVFIYLGIRTEKIALRLMVPMLIYLTVIVELTVSLVTSLFVIILYYYKLIFDQLTAQFEAIEKRSSNSISFMDQMRLIRLVKQHKTRNQEIHQINFIFRRSVAVFWVTVTLVQMIPLNLYLEDDNLVYQMIYLVYLIAAFLFGLTVSIVFTIEIRAAHKPAKLIYRILTKNLQQKKFGFHFKSKVKLIVFMRIKCNTNIFR